MIKYYTKVKFSEIILYIEAINSKEKIKNIPFSTLDNETAPYIKIMKNKLTNQDDILHFMDSMEELYFLFDLILLSHNLRHNCPKQNVSPVSHHFPRKSSNYAVDKPQFLYYYPHNFPRPTMPNHPRHISSPVSITDPSKITFPLDIQPSTHSNLTSTPWTIPPNHSKTKANCRSTAVIHRRP